MVNGRGLLLLGLAVGVAFGTSCSDSHECGDEHVSSSLGLGAVYTPSDGGTATFELEVGRPDASIDEWLARPCKESCEAILGADFRFESCSQPAPEPPVSAFHYAGTYTSYVIHCEAIRNDCRTERGCHLPYSSNDTRKRNLLAVEDMDLPTAGDADHQARRRYDAVLSR